MLHYLHYIICKKINSVLHKYINFYFEYTSKNSLELVNNITLKSNLPLNSKLVPFVVVHLCPSILKKKRLTVHLNLLNVSSHLVCLQKQELFSAIEIYIYQNDFHFNNTIFSQCGGSPMGSSLSPSLSEVFMSILEINIFSTNRQLTKNMFYLARYVDNIFCICVGSQFGLSDNLTLL